jgi:hypothetical protein
MGPTIERASERAVRTGFDVHPAHPSVRPAAGCAMIRSMLLTIAHRSLLGALALLVLAAPAGAAEVARIDGGSLDARDRDGELCLRVAHITSDFEGGGTSCAKAPWRPRRSSLVTWVAGDRLLAGGAVPAAITRAEAELSDGRRVGFETVAGPGYRGRYAGRLRFFLAKLPLADPQDLESGGLVAVRFFGSDGTLQGVAAGDFLGTPVGRRTVLLRERAGRNSTLVVGETLRRIVSTPLQLDRTEELTCIGVRSRSRYGETRSSTACHDEGPSRPVLAVSPERGCNGLRTVLSGFVGDAVTAVRVTLGSGRVREVRARTLRDPRGGEHRYVATMVPRGEAVRSLSAVGADASYDLGEPPSGLPCRGGLGFGIFLPGLDGSEAEHPPAGDEQVVAEAGGHRLVVRDGQADRLCIGIDHLLADQSDCQLPAVNGDEAFGFASSGIVSAVLPTEVARVRLPDGREIPTIEGGYSGRYAGAVRFLFVEATIGPEDRVRLLDSAGAVIGRFPVLDPDLYSSEPPFSSSVRLAGGRGWRLAASRHRYGTCVTLRLRGEDPQCVAFPDERSFDGFHAEVSCTPRLAVIAGTFPKGTRAVRAVLRGGRTLRARVLRVPRRYGGGRVWVLSVPRTAHVRAVRVEGGKNRGRSPFTLPPAAEQCGYSVDGSLPDGPTPLIRG